MNETTWTLEGYWTTILGVGPLSGIIRDHGMAGWGEAQVAAWLAATAEPLAWSAGGEAGPIPSCWLEHRRSAARHIALTSSVQAPAGEPAYLVTWSAGSGDGECIERFRTADAAMQSVQFAPFYGVRVTISDPLGSEIWRQDA